MAHNLASIDVGPSVPCDPDAHRDTSLRRRDRCLRANLHSSFHLRGGSDSRDLAIATEARALLGLLVPFFVLVALIYSLFL